MSSKRYIAIFTLLCVLVNVAYGAKAIRKPVPKPAELAHLPGCYDPDLKIVLPYEKPHFTQECSQFLCKTNDDIVITNCGVLGVTEDQVLVKGNRSLHYPDCCDFVEPKKP